MSALKMSVEFLIPEKGSLHSECDNLAEETLLCKLEGRWWWGWGLLSEALYYYDAILVDCKQELALRGVTALPSCFPIFNQVIRYVIT